MKSRMLYSLGVGTTHFSVKTFLSDSEEAHVVHRVEASDPAELTESFFTSRIGLDRPFGAASTTAEASSSLDAGAGSSSTKIGGSSEARFARPKGPGRKR